jgi:hypothetical protein
MGLLLCAAAASAVQLVTAASPPAPLQIQSGQRQLMIDRELLSTTSSSGDDGNAVIRMHRPRKTGQVVIKADEPWEDVIFYYDSIVQVSQSEFRIYYDAFGPLGRFMCVAISNDTLTWTKPNLGQVQFENSTDNNIILGAGGYIEPGTVFLDKNPNCSDREKFKMVATSNGGATMFSSSDGFKFTPMTQKPSLTGSDTQDVVWYDERYQQYVYYGRTHQRGTSPPCPPGTQGAGRSIGRMLLGKSAVTWPTSTADHVPTIFEVDALDAPCMDIYCNGATPYAGIYLMFPLMFWHFPGRGVNDGLLEPRVVASRNGVNFSYIGGSRDAFLPRGIGQARPNYVGIFEGEFDAAATAVARGVFEVGDKVVLIGYGSQYTHGGYSGFKQPGGPVMSGLQRLEIRKDGFGSLSSVNSTVLAVQQTVAMLLPRCAGAEKYQSNQAASKRPQLQLLLNVETSVGGYFQVWPVNVNGSAIEGFNQTTAVPFVGNYIGAAAKWGRHQPPAPYKPHTTCAYELPGGTKCSGVYVPMTCAQATRESKGGCAAHGCHGHPTACDNATGVCHGHLNGTNLCVLKSTA